MTVDKVLNQKVGNISLLDGFLISGSKIGNEELFNRFTPFGNGNYMSGGVKVLSAIGLNMASNNRWVKGISTGVLVDGMEDLVLAMRNQFRGNSNGNNQVGEVL